MELTRTSYSVAQYCGAMERNEIVVNQRYQRSGKVWPPPARSFFIETILLGYPIPKLTLYQYTDLKSRQTIYEIVDGQQRSNAILDYFNNGFRLSTSLDLEDARGRTFSELDEEYQHVFLNYSFSVDLFLAATPKEIREMFRRINSYTVPLNPEEQRHAVFQGDFKWFIYRLSRESEGPFLETGVFTENQIVRMQDTKLLSEICHAFVQGVRTTNRKMLDDLYETYEEQFDDATLIGSRIERAISRLASFEELRRSSLMRPHIVYSLLLALAHMEAPVETLTSIYERRSTYRYERDVIISNLSTLAEALEAPEELFDEPEGVEEPNDEELEDEEEPKLQEDLVNEELRRLRSFREASSSRTNVKAQREIRFKWMCRALEPELL